MPSRATCASLVAAFALVVEAGPAEAGWTLIPAAVPNKVGSITVVPSSEWNQASRRPGERGVAWTHDGFNLNGLELFGPVPSGQPLYKERDRKRNPMPRFDRAMLLPDLADFFERSVRIRHGLSDFSIEATEPAMLGTARGIAVHYRYSLPDDELVRRGEARLAVAKEQLYVADFYAPSIHYFEAGRAEAHAIMDGMRF